MRAEVAHLKAQFEQLCAEASVLFNSLLLIVELMLSNFLARQTRKTSRNSSLSSSKADKDDSSLPLSASKGKGKPRQGAAGNHVVRETVTIATINQCEVCGEPLSQVPCTGQERRARIDIVFEKLIQHVDAEIKQCPYCAATVRGRFPEDLHGPL